MRTKVVIRVTDLKSPLHELFWADLVLTSELALDSVPSHRDGNARASRSSGLATEPDTTFDAVFPPELLTLEVSLLPLTDP